jgi:S-adenosylmethionine synthetase
LSTECEIQLAYAIGVADPVSIRVDTFGTGKLADEAIADLVDTHFSFKPGHIIRDLGLAAPIYGVTAAGGHFGRQPDGSTFPWEALKSDVITSFKAAL